MPLTQRSAVAFAAALILLAGCGSSTSGGATPTPTGSATTSAPVPTAADRAVVEAITVTGGGGKVAPKVTLGKTPVSVSTTTVHVLKEGSGKASAAGDVVGVSQVLILGKDGTNLGSNFETGALLTVRLADGTSIVGLTRALTGVKVGSRLVAVIPPVDAFGKAGRSELGVSGTDNLVLVADVASIKTPLKKAEGTAVPPKAGLPTVTFDDSKGPTITMPKTAPPTTTVSQPLLVGTGATVAKGQSITVHYTGALWKDGSVFDSSWARGAPVDFPIGVGQVIKGWDNTLVGQKVGSRMLLVIPPADGYGKTGSPPKISGTDTLVFVVDILGAS